MDVIFRRTPVALAESEVFLRLREMTVLNVRPQPRFTQLRSPILTVQQLHIVSYAIITQRAHKPRAARVDRLYSCHAFLVLC